MVYPPAFMIIGTAAVAIGVTNAVIAAKVTRKTGPVGLHPITLHAMNAIGIKMQEMLAFIMNWVNINGIMKKTKPAT